MKVIGITGTSGSGKSTLSSWLAAQGYPVIDGDAVSRELAVPGSPYVAALVREFGPEICDAAGNLQRRALAARAFAAPEGQRRLTALTTPLIQKEIAARIARARDAGAELLFLDGALIIDTPFQQFCDTIIAVLSDEQTQLARICRRDGVSEAAARDRLARQMPAPQLRARADYVLENNGTKADFLRAAGQLLQRIKEPTR